MSNLSGKILLAPIWLHNVVIVALSIGIFFLGVALFLAIFAGDLTGAIIQGCVQYSFLSVLFAWNRGMFLDIPIGRKLIKYTPSEKALAIHMINKPCVYFLQDIDVTGYVKIGRSTNPYHRLRDFGVKLPFATRLVHIIEYHNDAELERFLHGYLANKRVRGEWFDLSDFEMESLKRFNPIEVSGEANHDNT